MKRILITILAAALVAGAQTRNDAERLLKAAQNTDVVDGNLKAAIEQYNAIAVKYENSDRAATATALIRMAECYSKLGTTEARRTYERVVRDFWDQKEAAAIARARLRGTPSL